MKSLVLTIFVIYASFVTASPQNPGTAPVQNPAGQTLPPIPDSMLNEIRKTVWKYSGHSPNLHGIMAGGVRTGHGGGGAMACWVNDDIAYAAIDGSSRAIKRGGDKYIQWMIPYDLLYKKKGVTTEDYEVYPPQYFFPSEGNEKPFAYLLRLIDHRIAKVNPNLANKLKSTLYKIGDRSDAQKWKKQEFLPVLLDLGEGGRPANPGSAVDWAGVNGANLAKSLFKKVNHDNCRVAHYTQLAIQFVVPTTGAVSVDYAYPMLDRMEATNRNLGLATIYEAALILHEVLYNMVIMKYGEYDSSSFRPLTSYLMQNAPMNAAYLANVDAQL